MVSPGRWGDAQLSIGSSRSQSLFLGIAGCCAAKAFRPGAGNLRIALALTARGIVCSRPSTRAGPGLNRWGLMSSATCRPHRCCANDLELALLDGRFCRLGRSCLSRLGTLRVRKSRRRAGRTDLREREQRPAMGWLHKKTVIGAGTSSWIKELFPFLALGHPESAQLAEAMERGDRRPDDRKRACMMPGRRGKRTLPAVAGPARSLVSLGSDSVRQARSWWSGSLWQAPGPGGFSS